MKNAVYILLFINVLTLMCCGKFKDNKPLNDLPQFDTIVFENVNTIELLDCMQNNDVDFLRDSFLIKSQEELEGNLVGGFCEDKLPQVNFQESMLAGFKTSIVGSGENNIRILVYDSLKNVLYYSISAFSNDTSLLRTELNWIILPKFETDSIIFNLLTIQQ